MRSRYAGQPFTTSTSDIAAALEQVSIPTLLLSLVHITGDPRFVRDFKPAGIFLNEVQGFMSDEDKARARAEALPVITDYRDRGCPEPAPLPPELIREMMDWAVCESVPDDYLALLAEEMDLDGVDPAPAGSAGLRPRARRSRWSSSAAANREFWPVFACGRPTFRSPSWRRTPARVEPGGRTAIPGARVDVANHFYCYSFEPSNDWSHFFAEQPELQSYFTQRDGQAWSRTTTCAGRPRSLPSSGTTRTACGRSPCARATRVSPRCRRAPSSPRSASSTVRTYQSSKAPRRFAARRFIRRHGTTRSISPASASR